MWTEDDDYKYSRWNRYTAKTTLTEENKVHPPERIEEIWPHGAKAYRQNFVEGYSARCFFGRYTAEEWSGVYRVFRPEYD